MNINFKEELRTRHLQKQNPYINGSVLNIGKSGTFR